MAAELLEARADPNVNCSDGSTPLHLCAIYNSIDIACKIIASKADVNISCTVGNTPLHTAARYGRRDIAELLVTAGALVEQKNIEGETPLKRAQTSGNIEVAIFLENAERSQSLIEPRAKKAKIEEDSKPTSVDMDGTYILNEIQKP